MSTPVLHLKQFGSYEIIRKLGRSMADVYLALDPAKDRRVVLKIIEQCRDPCTQIALDAERRGAMIQQQLHAVDSRILEIYEYGERDGCFFVAMQYAEGKSLAEILRREGRLDPARAARYAAEGCSQLTTLHTFQADIEGQKRAVVHGDIKPSNIQIGPNDEVWLLDFGIAKAITLTRNLTSHNLGSPAYCSPERLMKGQVDPHSDLWALGVSLYEMIAGMPPYQAQNTRRLENLIESRRPPRALPESCPAALRAVISKALAADIERRYRSAAALEADLRLFLGRRSTAAESEKQPSWVVNATTEKRLVVDEPPRIARGWLRVKSALRFSGLAWTIIAGLLLGLLCSAPASHFYRYSVESKPLRGPLDYSRATAAKVNGDWQLYRKLRQQNLFLGRLSPVHRLTGPFRAALTSAGADVIERYRNGPEAALDRFDWEKARASLAYALEIDGSDTESRGRMALADGYLQLMRQPETPEAARAKFEEARSYLPKSPDPHLGLARVYTYWFHNVGDAMAAFRAAERLGYRAGPREMEQQADGFLFRAEQQLRVWLAAASESARARSIALARRDYERARNLYEPIAGFSNVDRGLEQIHRAEDLQAKVQAERDKARREAARKRALARYRRWR